MQKRKNKSPGKSFPAAVFGIIKPGIEALPRCQLICINNDKVSLEGSFLISDFSREYVKLDLKTFYITIEGAGLEMICYGDKSVEVKGEISNIKYTKKGTP